MAAVLVPAWSPSTVMAVLNRSHSLSEKGVDFEVVLGGVFICRPNRLCWARGRSLRSAPAQPELSRNHAASVGRAGSSEKRTSSPSRFEPRRKVVHGAGSAGSPPNFNAPIWVRSRSQRSRWALAHPCQASSSCKAFKRAHERARRAFASSSAEAVVPTSWESSSPAFSQASVQDSLISSPRLR